jgi:hypothetical protein
MIIRDMMTIKIGVDDYVNEDNDIAEDADDH